MQKRWIINEKYHKDFEKEFPEFSSVMLQLLWDRNIKTQEKIDEFFNPDYEQDIHNPHLMKNIDRAAERIFQVLRKNEKVLVYGDYDVDGITASAILVNTFLEIKSVICGMNRKEAMKFVGIYIPDREIEGYGLNNKAIEEIKNEKKTNLIVTVDCGISNFNSVEFAKKLGIDIIITDHHHVPKKIPSAYAVVNPKQRDCKYPFKCLSGAGVAFKLAQVLIEKLKSDDCFKTKASIGFEKWLLDLVALGTIADCVDLVGENRTLAKYGLLVLNKTRREGLKKLISYTTNRVIENGNVTVKKEVDENVVSFILAPRLNAAGRMDHANTSYKLLVTESEKEAENLVKKLETNNRHRQKLTENIISEIKNRIENNFSKAEIKNQSNKIFDKNNYLFLPKVVVESGVDWKIGVVGLVAGKLSDEYSRPFLVLCEKEKESVGSGRSIPEFNLIEALEECRDLLVEFGGHSQAVGLKIRKENFSEFKKRINLIADKVLKEKHLTPSINIDCVVTVEQINWSLIDDIKRFAPFGYNNKKPIFLLKNLEVDEVRVVGNGGSHLKLFLKSILSNGTEKRLNTIGFNFGNMINKLPNRETGIRWGDIVDIAFKLEIDEWNGNREIQINIVDLKVKNECNL